MFKNAWWRETQTTMAMTWAMLNGSRPIRLVLIFAPQHPAVFSGLSENLTTTVGPKPPILEDSLKMAWFLATDCVVRKHPHHSTCICLCMCLCTSYIFSNCSCNNNNNNNNNNISNNNYNSNTNNNNKESYDNNDCRISIPNDTEHIQQWSHKRSSSFLSWPL